MRGIDAGLRHRDLSKRTKGARDITKLLAVDCETWAKNRSCCHLCGVADQEVERIVVSVAV